MATATRLVRGDKVTCDFYGQVREGWVYMAPRGRLVSVAFKPYVHSLFECFWLDKSNVKPI